jgi:chromosome segregation ATPase
MTSTDTPPSVVRLCSTPEFESASTQQKSKLVALEFLRAGQRPPSWTSMREYIGGGSNPPITAGIKEAQEFFVEELRTQQAMPLDGLQSQLVPVFNSLVAEAVKMASLQYAERDRKAVEVIDTLNGQVADLSAQVNNFSWLLSTERDNSAKLLGDLNDERLVNSQLEHAATALEAQLQAAQKELDALKQSSQTELEQLRAHNTNTIAQLDATHSKALLALRQSHDDELMMKGRFYRAEVAELRHQLDLALAKAQRVARGITHKVKTPRRRS